MNLRPVLSSLFVIAFALLVSACGPRWTVIRQAVPDPFVGQRQFVIEAIHFDNLMVGDKTERDYLAGKEGDQAASFSADKADMATRYAEALISASEGLQFPHDPSQGGFIVRPIVSFIEPGFYAFASHPTEVHMRVQLLNAQGQVLDEIAVRSSIPAGITNPASGNRIRQAGADLGRVTAKYLKSRVTP
jgi:hypothetical protein